MEEETGRFDESADIENTEDLGGLECAHDGRNQHGDRRYSSKQGEEFKVDLSALTEDDVRDLLERAKQGADYLDKLQMLQAEHENYRKRMAREAANHRLWALRDLTLDVLPAVDNLERALAVPPSESGGDAALRAGVKMVLDMLLESLARHGAKPIEALGKQFDPAFHEALGEMETPDYPPGKIAADVQKGYTLKDIVVRPSRVMVARPPSQ